MPDKSTKDQTDASEEGPIKGVVARILDSYSLIINRGWKHGVKTGMKFEVMDPEWVDITDPVSGEVIGSMPLIKATLEVTDVYYKMAVLVTFGRVITGGNTLGSMFGGPQVERREQLSYSGKSLSDETSSIVVGDEVEQVS